MADTHAHTHEMTSTAPPPVAQAAPPFELDVIYVYEDFCLIMHLSKMSAAAKMPEHFLFDDRHGNVRFCQRMSEWIAGHRLCAPATAKDPDFKKTYYGTPVADVSKLTSLSEYIVRKRYVRLSLCCSHVVRTFRTKRDRACYAAHFSFGLRTRCNTKSRARSAVTRYRSSACQH